MNNYFITASLKLSALKDHPKASATERKLLHKNTLNPPDVNLINKWKCILHREQVEQFNLYAGDLLENLGYDLV